VQADSTPFSGAMAKLRAETSGVPIFSLHAIAAAADLAKTIATAPTEVRDSFAAMVAA